MYFDIYESKCYGAWYCDMKGYLELKLAMMGFVNDNNCNVNCRPDQEHNLCNWAAHDAQLWNNILWSSGRALEHSKCLYRYLKTEFPPTGIPTFMAGSFGTPIKIRNASGTEMNLTHMSAYTAYKTLGTYQAATQNQQTQFEVLKKKASHLMRTLALGSCSSNASWLYFSSIFMKGIGFPLAVSRLTKAQLHAIHP
jgi:hypothetical protein